jgi:endonuclease VIII
VPEGDTIWRTAGRLHEHLAGRVVTRFTSTLARVAAEARRYRVAPRAGRGGARIFAVEARGKHLLIRFATDPAVALHTHMGMTGSWHLYRPGSRWRKPEHLARVVIDTADVVAVCFTAPTVRWLREGEEAALEVLAGLGPDVLSPTFDAAEALRRLRARPRLSIAAALLDQRALSGIGNIYRSEALYLSAVDPFTPVESLEDESLDRVVERARRLMRRNLDATVRVTAAGGGGRTWVYRRAGRPCRRCGTPIRMQRHGQPPRSVYWCPRCQGDTAGRTGTGTGT